MGLCPLLLRPVRERQGNHLFTVIMVSTMSRSMDLCIGYSSEVIGGKNRHRNLSSRPGFRYRRVMFPGHVYREKVYCWWGQVLKYGMCIDGCDEILPSDPEYTWKRDFILAFKRGEACTKPFAQKQSRPKLFIEAWERDEEWTKPL
jgi:hypothetical protein